MKSVRTSAGRLRRRAIRLLREVRGERGRETVREVHGGARRQRDKVCLFAHFDPHGRIDPYVERHITVLADLGFDVIVSSASPSLDPDDVRRVLPRCRAVIRRDNRGLDFGSWQAAMATFPDVWKYDRMLLTNDTLFGPFSDLGAVLTKMEDAAEQVCGLNDSVEIAPHLQSFFLYFKRPVLRNRAVRRYWRDTDFSVGKRRIVEVGEIGLSRCLMDEGYELFSAYPLRDVMRVAESRGSRFQYRERLSSQPMNPSLMMWDILLTDFQYPYVKAELLRVNRLASNAAPNWRALIDPNAAAVADDVERYLRRIGVSAVPLSRAGDTAGV